MGVEGRFGYHDACSQASITDAFVFVLGDLGTDEGVGKCDHHLGIHRILLEVMMKENMEEAEEKLNEHGERKREP